MSLETSKITKLLNSGAEIFISLLFFLGVYFFLMTMGWWGRPGRRSGHILFQRNQMISKLIRNNADTEILKVIGEVSCMSAQMGTSQMHVCNRRPMIS